MPETLDRTFAATHNLDGILVMRNPDWNLKSGFIAYWIDEAGITYRSGRGAKAVALSREEFPAATLSKQGERFGQSYGLIGEVIATEWWISALVQHHSPKGVMVTREAAAAALRACAWPDSAAPCGQAGNSNDDDATFEHKDEDGNCIVRLFMRGLGYRRVKIPAAMFLEIVDE